MQISIVQLVVVLSIVALVVVVAMALLRGKAQSQGDALLTAEHNGHSALSLMDRWNHMFGAVIMMPIEIFALARDMVDHPDRALIGELLDEGYDVCNNKFQRRVFFTYVRFAEGGETGIRNLSVRILDGLASESGWVAYDAAWACVRLPNLDPVVLAKLQEIAAAHPLPIEGVDDDDWFNFYRKVHEVLDRLDA